jgi:hypothetical protein
MKNYQLTVYALQVELEEKNSELQKAFKEIKILQGFLPICASCKNKLQ